MKLQTVQSLPGELIPRSELRQRGLELRGTTAADFGYPDGVDLFECLWYAVANCHRYKYPDDFRPQR